MSLADQPIIITPQTLFRQIVSEAGITNKSRQQRLKRQLHKKYSLQMSLIQSHHLRDNRFVFSQKQVLEKQHQSIEKTKQSINLKQNKAASMKFDTLSKRIKRTQSNLCRWQQIIQKNKDQHKNQIKHSEKLIQNWNDKLSSSTSRKSLRLSQFSKNHKEKAAQIEERVQSTRRIFEEQRLKESKVDKSLNHLSGRYQSSRSKQSSRISTESMTDKKRKIDEFIIQKQLVKTIRKQQKISAARSMRFSMLSKRIQQKQNKQQYLKKMRESNINELKLRVEEKNLILDEQFKRNKKYSLPEINQATPKRMLFMDSSNQHKGIKKHIKTQQSRIYQRSYDRLIMQKLRDVTMLFRRHK